MSRHQHPNSARAEEPMPGRRTCATMRVHQRLLDKVPGYATARSASENHARAFARKRGMVDRQDVTVIPVVVHVVYDQQRPNQNISEAQIRSQIDVLNQDYRAKNPDLAKVPAVFRDLAADARIEFELASVDPSGQPTNGIMRTATTRAGFADDDSVKAAATGGADPWPADQYLNIWVCQLKGGLLGYAQFPGGPPETDGVVILHSAFGTTGTAQPPFNLGRSCTHEVGHWLNLRHIWGDDGNGCHGSDFVDDTPNQAGPNYGKPVFPHVSCGNGPNGDLFMDYLDYVDDDAMHMFTAGQVERMHACLDNERASIGRAKGEESPAAPPPWPPDPPEVDGADTLPPEPPPGPDAPPFGPFGPNAWPWPALGWLPALLSWFGTPRAWAPASPWLGPSGAFPYPGIPTAPSAGAWASGLDGESVLHEGRLSAPASMFEAQLKAYERAIRFHKQLGARGMGGAWYRRELDRLYHDYLAIVHAYRLYLANEACDC